MITLTREGIDFDTGSEGFARHAWPVRITATGAFSGSVDNNIFVYRAALGSEAGDTFECVASVQQLQELGLTPKFADGDNKRSQVPYYRYSIAEFNARSAKEANETWNEIVTQVRELADNWAAFVSMSVIDIVSIDVDQFIDAGPTPAPDDIKFTKSVDGSYLEISQGSVELGKIPIIT